MSDRLAAPTTQELLDAIRHTRASEDGPPGAMTRQELQEALGLTRFKVQQALAALRMDGRLRTHTVYRPDATGRLQRLPAYTIAPAPRKPTARR